MQMINFLCFIILAIITNNILAQEQAQNEMHELMTVENQAVGRFIIELPLDVSFSPPLKMSTFCDKTCLIIMPYEEEAIRTEVNKYAGTLAEEMFSKLLGNEPITMEYEIKYFGLHNIHFLKALGYLDNMPVSTYNSINERIKIDLPKYSPFLELIRMKKILQPKFSNKWSEIVVYYRQYQYEQDRFTTNAGLNSSQIELAESRHITFIQKPKTLSDLTTKEDISHDPLISTIEFVYDKDLQPSHFLCSSFTLNGQNIIKHLGFVLSEEGNLIPPPELLEELKAHLQELENRHNTKEKQASSE